MKRSRSLLIFTIFLSFIVLPNVFAVVLTFEDLYPGYEGYGPLPSGYGGFSWSEYTSWGTKYDDPDTGYDYGTIGMVSIFTASAQTIYMSDGTFDFNGAYITSAWNDYEEATVEGWQGGVLKYSVLIVTDNDYAHWFDFGFKDVDTVYFIPGYYIPDPDMPGGGAHLVIDNITYNEPIATVIQGHVTDTCGTTIQQATIVALNRPDKIRTFTDSVGNYRIEGISAGIWKVLCWKSGYKFEIQIVTVDEGEVETVNFVLTPKARSEIPPEYRDAFK